MILLSVMGHAGRAFHLVPGNDRFSGGIGDPDDPMLFRVGFVFGFFGLSLNERGEAEREKTDGYTNSIRSKRRTGTRKYEGEGKHKGGGLLEWIIEDISAEEFNARYC